MIDDRKYLVLGHAGHGKDTFAREFLHNGRTYMYVDASEIAFEEFIRPHFASFFIYMNYAEWSIIKRERPDYRAIAFRVISRATIDNLTVLADKVFEEGNIYCGCRRNNELEAIREKYDNLIVYWVDRRGFPLESEDSMQIRFDPSYMIHVDSDLIYSAINKM